MAADYTAPTMSQHEISAMKDTLAAQQRLLQKLYNELEAERESSATAASEALSVILRLQGEKAAVKMEAEQYKRLAEEKMCHAEESFAIIEGIIHQREMEMATLDYQLQSYRYRLQSMGVVDPAGGEFKYPENLLQRGESLGLGRRNSAPVLVKFKKALMEWERSPSPELDMACTIGQELPVDNSSHGGGINSYAEEIRKLDVRVKEFAGPDFGGLGSPTLLSSRPSAMNLSCMSNSHPKARSPSPRPMINCEAASYPSSYAGVHDVFEVPQVDKVKTEEVTRSKDVGVMLSGKDDQLDRLKKLVNQISGIGEEKSSSSREEEVQLLKEIKYQLNLLQGEIIRSHKAQKSSEPWLCSLSEAMIHFWL